MREKGREREREFEINISESKKERRRRVWSTEEWATKAVWKKGKKGIENNRYM